MIINDIGISAHARRLDGSLEQLAHDLDYFQKLGYTLVEIPTHGIDVIVNGRLHRPQVARAVALLNQFDFRYSMHIPNRTNLAYGADLAKEREVLRAALEFCHEIDAQVLVYHSGLQALDAADTGVAPLPDAEALARGVRLEAEALQELAPLAAELGVTIAVENGDAHLWEYAVLQRYGLPPEKLAAYHARLCIPPVVAQFEAVGRPHVGLTLDLGHLHIAAYAVGFDYLPAVEQAAPWVRHIHIHDNFGVLDVGFEAQRDRLPYGEGDLHLPPGWGTIPFAETFARLPDYKGDLVLEIKPRYWEHYGEALENTRRLLAQVKKSTRNAAKDNTRTAHATR